MGDLNLSLNLYPLLAKPSKTFSVPNELLGRIARLYTCQRFPSPTREIFILGVPQVTKVCGSVRVRMDLKFDQKLWKLLKLSPFYL